jgi:hypothetical protein
MSFKVNRIKSEKESYKTTVNWLNDFSKSANFQDRIKERRDKPVVEKFSTIEDKMEDMKKRVGFSNLKNISASKSSCNHINKFASGCGCETEECSCDIGSKEVCQSCQMEDCSCEEIKLKDGGSCKICEKRDMISSDETLSSIRDQIQSLLIYIDNLISDRGYSTKAEVYGHCMSNPSLNFSSLSKKIDPQKLENHMGSLFEKYKKEEPMDIEYIPRDSIAAEGLHDPEDMTPSYFKSSNY